jgi:nicotinate-nucleotide adenylyltransferase
VSPARVRSRRPAPLCLGVFGGTFDPPHVGHLALAEFAREELALDRVLFVPAGEPPHKRAARTPAKSRLALVRAAVRGNPAFVAEPMEVRRRGPSYTVDTLRALAARHPGAALWLIVGADMWATMDTWREIRAIAELAAVAVATRPGTRLSRRAAWAKGGRGVRFLGNPALDVSSSAVRDRARRGRSLRYLVTDPVARAIAAGRLYRRSA